MEGPEESEAGLYVIAEVCWEPAYLLVSFCVAMAKGREGSGKAETNQA